MFDLDTLNGKIDDRSITTEEILNAISDVIDIKFKNPVAASKYLPVFAKYYLFSRDNAIIKTLFYLCEEFKVYDDIVIQRYVSYTFFMVYYVLPSYPKAIEYGLELENSGYNYPFMKINTFKFMAVMCYSLNLLDETIKYSQKCLDATMYYFDTDTDIFQTMNVIYLNNLLLINIKNKNYLSATINKDKLSNYLDLINHHSKFDNIYAYSELSFLFYSLIFEKKFEQKKYIDLMHQLMTEADEFVMLEMPIDVHIELINALDTTNNREDIIAICKFIINCKKIIGDKSIIQIKLFDLFEDRNNQKNIKKYINEYREIINNYFKTQTFINKAISLENFRLNKLENRLLKIDDRVSKDYLTNCYNRFMLNSDWDSIYTKNPNGGTLVFIDIDNLKIVNDLFGHESGDHHIIQIVEAIKAKKGPSDRLYRFGGDEFILLSLSEEEDLNNVFKQIIDDLEAKNNSSFSYGIASFGNNASLEEIIEVADKKMYEMKNYKKFLR